MASAELIPACEFVGKYCIFYCISPGQRLYKNMGVGGNSRDRQHKQTLIWNSNKKEVDIATLTQGYQN